jgi:hypothetical protein
MRPATRHLILTFTVLLLCSAAATAATTPAYTTTYTISVHEDGSEIGRAHV